MNFCITVKVYRCSTTHLTETGGSQLFINLVPASLATTVKALIIQQATARGLWGPLEETVSHGEANAESL